MSLWREKLNNIKECFPDLKIKSITSPPCKDCHYFHPCYNSNLGNYDGITVCHAEEMFYDFSCFRDKIGDNNE